MNYGEIQAIFQLAVGLNIGVYALKDISLSGDSMITTNYNYMRLSMDRRAAELKRIESNPERQMYDDLLSVLNEKVVDRWAKTNKYKQEWSKFVTISTFATGIMAFISLYFLFITSYKYTEAASCFTIFFAYFVYAPGVATIGFHLLIRYLSGSFEAGQVNIDQELLKIDRFILDKSV